MGFSRQEYWSGLPLLLIWKMVFPEVELGGLSGLAHPSPYLLKAVGVSLGFGESAPWIWCWVERWPSVVGTGSPPAGSRLSSLCCNRKGFCDSQESHGILVRVEEAVSLLWFAQQCKPVPVKCKVVSGWRSTHIVCSSILQTAGREARHSERSRPDLSSCGRAGSVLRLTDSQVRVAFKMSAGKMWNRVRFVNCRVRCLLSPSTGPAPECPAGETPAPGPAFRLVLINDTIKPCVWKNSVASEMKSLHLYYFKER